MSKILLFGSCGEKSLYTNLRFGVNTVIFLCQVMRNLIEFSSCLSYSINTKKKWYTWWVEKAE